MVVCRKQGLLESFLLLKGKVLLLLLLEMDPILLL
jgi:hypothetical protein